MTGVTLLGGLGRALKGIGIIRHLDDVDDINDARHAAGFMDEGASVGDDLVECVAKGLNSFSGDTGVLMADGSTKRIDAVVVGDLVLATDPETGETGARAVIATIPHTDQLLELETSAGDVVTTEDHHYWNATDQAWQQSQHLDPGDRLHTPDGTVVTVEGLDWATAHTAPAYDLTINDLHTFYVLTDAEPVLVHNCAKKAVKGGATERRVAGEALTNSQATDLAKWLGFRPVNGVVVHGQKVFTNGKLFISHDIDGHNGGIWKIADSIKKLLRKETRDGTYDYDLTRIGD